MSLDEIVTLKELGAKRSTLDVLARSDWTLGFDLGAVSGMDAYPPRWNLTSPLRRVRQRPSRLLPFS